MSRLYKAFPAILLALLLLSAGSTRADEDRFAPLNRFSQVLGQVEAHYVKSVTRSELIDGAITGMLQQLDPHSSFCPRLISRTCRRAHQVNSQA